MDEARRVPNSTVVFFYCKQDNETRNSFIAVARSILAQILSQNDHLLPYFYEMACANKDAVLTKTSIAEEMLQTTLKGCKKTYIVLDGLDECGKTERRKISSWFLGLIEALTPEDMDSIRCLFISQYDGIAENTLGHLPTINITTQNKADLRDFATVWHKKMEEKFGNLQSNDSHIANIISARAQGWSDGELKHGKGHSSDSSRHVYFRGGASKTPAWPTKQSRSSRGTQASQVTSQAG